MKPDELVADRFEVSECVGSGSCGAVFRAWDRVLEREVAIKQLDRAIDEQVMRTSRAAARLNHPAIVPLYEVGESCDGAFLVSEYIDGMTLRQAHRAARLTDRDVAEIGADLCAGLHHAHERGVVHGDIKPENVIVRSREQNPDQRAGRCQAKLRDFATREILAGEADPGSAYLTPEQIDGAKPTPASDIFGVALILFECWTGRNPFAGASAPGVARIRGRHIPGLAELRPDLPSRLTAIVDSALDPEPARRPDALDLRDWLDHVFDDLDFELAVPEPTPVPAPRRSPFADALLTVATVAGSCGLAIAGAAPAAFALASWPAAASSRALLAAFSTIAVLALAALLDPGAAPVELATGGSALLTPYAALLIVLWSAAAVALGTLARAPAPVSGVALGTAFCLIVLIASELLERASHSQSLAAVAPVAGIAALAAAAAVVISRHAARTAARAPGGDAPTAGERLVPPEPEGIEPTITARHKAENLSGQFRLARVP